VKTYTIDVDNFSRGPESPPEKTYPAPVYQAPLLLVTSFSPAGYEDYGKRFLETFIRYWPDNVILAVFHEGSKPEIDDTRIWYFNLLADEEYRDWLVRYGHDERNRGIRDGKRDFRWDAVRFAPKVFSLTSPILPTTGWRIWIDADVETTAKIPEVWFSKLLRTDATALYLGRPKSVFQTSECGFVAYHTGIESGRQFLKDLRQNYTEGKIFGFPEWHDSAVFDILRGAYENVGCTFKDIAAGYYAKIPNATFEEHGHPWPHTVLGQYLTHYKGPAGKEKAITHRVRQSDAVDLKRLCNDPSLKSRYDQVIRILSVLPHEIIVEVGVARGQMALAMCRVNLERGKKVRYIGFDLFEGITDEISEQEMNGKKVDSKAIVSERLEELSQAYPGLLEYELVQGNTRETLPAYKFPSVDVAFIDGGHSVETIESDYKALEAHANLILLDDYYEEGVDTEKFGCNRLFDGTPERKILLPVVDRAGDKKIRIVALGEILRKAGEPMPLRIKTRNCLPDEEIQANVENAYKYRDMTVWLPAVLRPVEDPVLFVGGSPTVTDPECKSYEHNWYWIKSLADQGHRIVVCKTSYQHALSHGVLPWGCLLLDPRDHVAEWIEPLDERVNYFIASMCHPTTWAHVAKPGIKLYGYHAGVGAHEAEVILKLWGDAPVVHGGTTSTFRGLSLLYNMGFRKFKTIGLDSSYPSKPKKLHGRSEKPLQNVTIGREYGMGREFWTDPELIAQSQDAEMFTKLHPLLEIEYLGDGLLQHAQKVLREMIRRADPLAHGPREQMVSTWLQCFKAKEPLPEALYLDDILSMLTQRSRAMEEKLYAQPTFDALINTQESMSKVA
jgi:hypothetical protein